LWPPRVEVLWMRLRPESVPARLLGRKQLWPLVHQSFLRKANTSAQIDLPGSSYLFCQAQLPLPSGKCSF
jgi:hypothetical protein